MVDRIPECNQKKCQENQILKIRKVTTWGNALGIRLPSTFVNKHGITKEQYVVITEDDESILIRPCREGNE